MMMSPEPRERLLDREWLKQKIQENALRMQSNDKKSNQCHKTECSITYALKSYKWRVEFLRD